MGSTLSDVDVLKEIEKLSGSEFVKLARKYNRIQYRARQKLYSLRNLDKKGRELASAGITIDMLDDEQFIEEEFGE
jgi:hypothetical protein